jgi:hypothetical protein
MRFLHLLLSLIISVNCLGQASMTTSGNWATAANWSGSNIGNVVTETVAISNNINPTINSGSNFTVGATTLNNNNTLTISSGGTLNVGDATHPVNLSTNNNANVTVTGTLVIWGNLVVNNNIVWNITGTVIIKGNVQLNNSANLNVSGGTLQVGGNFVAGNNTNVSVPSGSISIGGSVNVGGGSNLGGCTGCFSVGTGCTGPSSFCSGGVLPITLMSFDGHFNDGKVVLAWATASEINFDHFEIETSTDGQDFTIIGSVPGHGTSNSLINYSFEHITPMLGQNYYRLKSIDFDATSEYSNVISVRAMIEGTVALFPNPVQGANINLFVNFSPLPGDYAVIYNYTGAPVSTINLLRQGTINIPHVLSPGIYLLSYSAAGKRATIRFSIE